MTVTVAPAITPPLWSVSVPKIRPALPCENAGRQIKNIPIIAPSSCTTCFILGDVDVVIIDCCKFIEPTPRNSPAQKLKRRSHHCGQLFTRTPADVKAKIPQIRWLVQNGIQAGFSFNSNTCQHLLLADRMVVDQLFGAGSPRGTPQRGPLRLP